MTDHFNNHFPVLSSIACCNTAADLLPVKFSDTD